MAESTTSSSLLSVSSSPFASHINDPTYCQGDWHAPDAQRLMELGSVGRVIEKRCKGHGLECSYPEPTKRRPRSGTVARTDLPRGQNVELGTSRIDESSLQTRAELLHETLCSDIVIGSSSAFSTAAIIPTPGITLPQAYDLTNLFANTDITNALRDAISQVQKFRLQDITKSAITARITLPTPLLRSWIHNYFAHVRTESFLTLVDSRLIKMIPDIIDTPHVHLDAGIIVVYHTILYHGCVLPAAFVDSNDTKYARQIYLCCLRALPNWQREARGTMTDFVAATLMARAAAECFDYEMSWQMYKLACEYATGLNMHNLDSEDALSGLDQSKVDEDRKGLWELIQLDLFFRLLYNKPPTLTSSMSNWRVNFPWLSANSQPDMHAIPTMTFLVGSRITLTLIQFFKLLEEERHDAHVLPKVQQLCEDINHLFQDWQLEQYLQQDQDNDIYWWMVADVFLMGYTCIIFMLQKISNLPPTSPSASCLRSCPPPSTLIINASRKILDIIYRLLTRYPVAETMSMMVGFFQAFVPYGLVANNVLRSPNPRAFVSDLELLERVAERIVALSEIETDFKPMARALRRANKEVWEWVNMRGAA
ncbi:hypothetical protein DER44DRAFT_679162 [Fusarium oxysporum]|nr:hypothetical protein DER44DRAFT_679162 [Fusarium oxysporum]